MKARAVIFDLDGTLALHNGREWYEYEKCETDLTCRTIDAIYRAYERDGDAVLLIMTGRPVTYEAQTVAWLMARGFVWHRLYMRPAGDYSSNPVYKRAVLEQHILPNYDVIAAFEDHPAAVKVFTELGITVFQPHRPGSHDTFYDSKEVA